jgi:hypothetical protein
MFLVKAGTVIQIEVSKELRSFNWGGWKPYMTKEDKIYDKDEVWDMVAVANERDDVPDWARRNITEHGYTVIKRAGKYAMVPAVKIEYLD